jgi:hypothetical protein
VTRPPASCVVCVHMQTTYFACTCTLHLGVHVCLPWKVCTISWYFACQGMHTHTHAHTHTHTHSHTHSLTYKHTHTLTHIHTHAFLAYKHPFPATACPPPPFCHRYIKTDAHKMEVAVKPPMAVTNAVSWRTEGIRHKKNEVCVCARFCSIGIFAIIVCTLASQRSCTHCSDTRCYPFWTP